MKRIHRRDLRPSALLIAALSLACGCDALFRPFLEPGPQPCSAGCAADQTCNPTSNLCESPSDLGMTEDGSTTPPTGSLSQLSLLAGAIGGRGNANDSGASARFNLPTSVAVDMSGNVYVAEEGGHTIRRIAAAGGVVTLVAGSPGKAGYADGQGPSALFNGPQGLVLDDANGLYVADSNNNRIRQINLSTGAVTTVAGNGTPGSGDGIGTLATFNSPCALAIRSGSLLVVDANSSRIRSMLISTGQVSTLNSAPLNPPFNNGALASAAFQGPRGITVDSDGSVYVADTGNHLIRKIDIPGATVSTLAGGQGMPGATNAAGATARFSRPWGISADRAGNLFVVDSDAHTLRKIVISTAEVSTLAGVYASSGSTDGSATAARFLFPQGVSFAGGYLYVADTKNHKIRVVTVSSANVGTLAGTATGAGSASGTMASARFSSPGGIAADGAKGLAYIVDKTNSTIRQAEVATGKVTTLAGQQGGGGSADGFGTSAVFFAPHSAVLDGAGNLYVTDSANHTIRRIVLATAEVSTVAGFAMMAGSDDGTGGGARFATPAGIAIDAAGTLYVADSINHAIRRITTANSVYVVTTLAGAAGMVGFNDAVGSSARFSTPLGIAIAPDGDVLVGDSGNAVIRRINPSTHAVSTLAGMPGQVGASDGVGSAARFGFPQGLAVDKAGILYVADSSNSAIRRVDLGTSAVSTIVGTPGSAGVKLGPLPARLNYPSAVAVLPSGLLISDLFENAVLYAH